MSEIAIVGLDLAKTVFQVHGAGRSGQVMLRKRLRRDRLLSFFSALPESAARISRLGRSPGLGMRFA